MGKDSRGIPLFMACSFRSEDKEITQFFKSILSTLGFDVYTMCHPTPQDPVKKALKEIRRRPAFAIVLVKRGRTKDGLFNIPSWLSLEGMLSYLSKHEKLNLIFIENTISPGELGPIRSLIGQSDPPKFNRDDLIASIDNVAYYTKETIELYYKNPLRYVPPKDKDYKETYPFNIISDSNIIEIKKDGLGVMEHILEANITSEKFRGIKHKLFLSPHLRESIPPIKNMVENFRKRRNDKQQFCYKLLSAHSPHETIKMKIQDLPKESTGKMKLFRVKFDGKLSLPSKIKYGWAWSCPHFFKTRGDESYDYCLYHDIKTLTFIIKFELPSKANLHNFIEKPKLQIFDPSENPISIPEEGILETSVNRVEYKWIKPGKAGLLYKIFWRRK